MDNEIEQALEQALNASVQEHDRYELEAYIRRAAVSVESLINLAIWTTAQTPQQDAYAKMRQRHLSMIIARALETVMRRELLDEDK